MENFTERTEGTYPFRILPYDYDGKNSRREEKYCREALELYGNFTYAANELAVVTIQKDTRIQIFSNRLSVNRHRWSYYPIRLLPCCMKANIQKADSVLTLVPEEVVSEDLQAIVQALAGYYNDAFEKVAATSPFNEVVMLLAMKKKSGGMG